MKIPLSTFIAGIHSREALLERDAMEIYRLSLEIRGMTEGAPDDDPDVISLRASADRLERISDHILKGYSNAQLVHTPGPGGVVRIGIGIPANGGGYLGGTAAA